MSFQAYLDNIETKTGKTPNEFGALARRKGYDAPDTKAGTIVTWLEDDFGLGRAHAMALVHVIEKAPRSVTSTWARRVSTVTSPTSCVSTAGPTRRPDGREADRIRPRD